MFVFVILKWLDFAYIFVCLYQMTHLNSSSYIVKLAGCSPSAVQGPLNRSLGGQSVFNLARYPLGGLFWLPPSILRVIKARPRWKSPPGFAYLCRAAHTKTQGQWKFPEQTPSVSPPRPQLVFSRYLKRWECVSSLKSTPHSHRSPITQVEKSFFYFLYFSL